jgi:hypothetical protein
MMVPAAGTAMCSGRSFVRVQHCNSKQRTMYVGLCVRD